MARKPAGLLDVAPLLPLTLLSAELVVPICFERAWIASKVPGIGTFHAPTVWATRVNDHWNFKNLARQRVFGCKIDVWVASTFLGSDSASLF